MSIIVIVVVAAKSDNFLHISFDLIAQVVLTPGIIDCLFSPVFEMQSSQTKSKYLSLSLLHNDYIDREWKEREIKNRWMKSDFR